MSLDHALLKAYVGGSWGYGQPDRTLWFVGTEQGGGTTLVELQRRLDAWDRGGRQPFDDLMAYCRAIGETRWTRPDPPLQPTWKHLIRTALCSRGRPVSREAIRQYQSTSLGRSGGESCLLELLPLPSRNMGTWLYKDWTSQPEFATRAAYLSSVGSSREAGLRRLIDAHRPRAVVFYGLDYQERWQRIVEQPFLGTSLERVSVSRRGTVLCLSVPHPVAFGVTGELFERVGHLIAAEAPANVRG